MTSAVAVGRRLLQPKPERYEAEPDRGDSGGDPQDAAIHSSGRAPLIVSVLPSSRRKAAPISIDLIEGYQTAGENSRIHCRLSQPDRSTL